MNALKFKILFAMVALISVISIIFTGCGGQSSEDKADSSADNKSKKIVVGFDDSFPPFGFRNEKGEIVGFDIDFAREVIRRMGREVEFKSIVWSSKEDELNSGNIDMIWNGLEIADERRQHMIFSRPYMNSGSIVFIHHTHYPTKITSKEKLAGLIIGVQKDSSAEMHIRNDNDLKFSITDLKLYDDSLTALKDLESRKVDAVVCDEINGRYYIFKHDLQNKVDPLPINIGNGGKIAVGFRKSDINLRNEVQQTIDGMIKDGTAKRISEQWFGKDLITQN